MIMVSVQMTSWQENEANVLHLDRFLATPGETPGADATGESQTVFIARSAAELCRRANTSVVMPRDARALPPATLLGIVTYCYVKGVYASDDIERELLREPAVREATKHEVPRPDAIRRFRRLNREAIRALLEESFRFLRRKARQLMVRENLAQLAVVSAQEAAVTNSLGEETAVFVRREAADILQKASFVDGMST